MSAVPPTIPGSGLYNNLQIYSANFNNVTVVNSVNIWKGYVNAATTTDVSLSGYQTIDTIATTEGSLVLVKDNVNGVQNGIYVISDTNWTRSPDLIDGSSASGIGMIVVDGSVNLNRIYVCTNTEDTVTVGVSSLTFGTSVNESAPAGSNGQLQYLLNNMLTADTSLTNGSGKYTMSSLAVSGPITTSSIKGTEYQINNKVGSGVYIDSGNVVIKKDSIAQLTINSAKIINELPTLYAGSGSYSFTEDIDAGMSTNIGDFQINNGDDYLSFQNTGIYTNVPTVSTNFEFNTSSSISLSSNKILLNDVLTLDPNTTGSNYTNVNITAPGYNINSNTGINYSTAPSITTTANGTQTMQLTETDITFNVPLVTTSYLLADNLMSRTGLVSESNDINIYINEVSKLNISSTGLTATVPIDAPSYLFYGDTDTSVISTNGSLNFNTGGVVLLQLNDSNISTGYDIVVPQGAVSALSLSTTQDTTSGIFSNNQTIDIVANQIDLMTVSSTAITTPTAVIATDLSSYSLNCYQIHNLGPTVPALSLSSGVYNIEGTVPSFSSFTMEYLVVAGGGGGGGGGGGAGGVISSSQSLSTTSLTITVGAGGAGVLTAGVNGSNGSNSSLSGTSLTTVTAIGGGGGASTLTGSSGGSGGGGGINTRGGAGTVGQGNSGGTGVSLALGGGGGAGAVGANGSGTTGGGGGTGISISITGSAVFYGGGGGGGANTIGGSGGQGGGGAGGGSGGSGTSGSLNTGGGGGGGFAGGTSSGSGGSGIVILRMPTTAYTGSIISGGSLGTDYTVAVVTTDTVISFKTVGTYTFTTLSSYCDFLNLDQNTNYILNGFTGKGASGSTSFTYFVYRNVDIPIGTIISGSGITSTSLNISSNVLQLADSSIDRYYSLNAVINSNKLLNLYKEFILTYLVVAGGGSGYAAVSGGGGGGGGLISSSQSVTVSPNVTSLSVTVGNGGLNANGSNSSISGTGFTTVTAIGGGAGSSSSNGPGSSGGSGGGGIGVGQVGGSGTVGQGNNGGTGAGSTGGGGGGAGAVGSNATFGNGGNGGIGLSSSITGTEVFYAGGGGGRGSTTSGTGGNGGGGNGGGGGGTANTGGGGGGSNGGGTLGGSGIVILAIPTSVYSGSYTGTVSPSPYTFGSNTILRFTTNGTYIF